MGIIGNWGRRIAAAAAALALCACAVPSGALASVDGQDPCACDHDHCTCNECTGADALHETLEAESAHALTTQNWVSTRPRLTKQHMHALLYEANYQYYRISEEYNPRGTGPICKPFKEDHPDADPALCDFDHHHYNDETWVNDDGKQVLTQHTYEAIDVGDPGYHFTKSTCGYVGCGKYDIGVNPHYDDNRDGFCDGCGHQLVKNCPHQYTDEYQYDGYSHWLVCTLCGEWVAYEPHDVYDMGDGRVGCRACNWTGKADEEECKHEWEVKYDKDYHWEDCVKCGDEKEGSRAKHKAVWTPDTTNGDKSRIHWKACECGMMVEGTEGSHLWQTKRDGKYTWDECALCHVKTSKKQLTVAEPEVKSADRIMNELGIESFPTVVDIAKELLGGERSASVVYWIGSTSEPAGEEKITQDMQTSDQGAVATYKTSGNVTWDGGKAPAPTDDVYAGVKYEATDTSGTTRSYVTGRTFVGVPRVEGEGWEVRPDGRWGYLRQMMPVKSEWVYWEDNWYWLDADGAMATGWRLIDGSWYLFGGSGIMKTGWQWIGGEWFYLGSSGAMKTGWAWDGHKYYYLSEQEGASLGVMQRSTVAPDGYTVAADGSWDTSAPRQAPAVPETPVTPVTPVDPDPVPETPAEPETPKTPDEPEIEGAWEICADNYSMLDRTEAAVFDEATYGLEGAAYEPVAVVACQVVEGTNRAYLALGTMSDEAATQSWCLLSVYTPLEGVSELLDIKRLEGIESVNLAVLRANDPGETQAGGWTVNETVSSALPDEAEKAWAAADLMSDNGLVPVALLSTQTVAGTNYRFFCLVPGGTSQNAYLVDLLCGLDGSVTYIEGAEYAFLDALTSVGSRT